MWKEISYWLIPILTPSMLLPLLHSEHSEREEKGRSERRDGQKTAQICTAMLCQVGGGGPLWARLLDFKYRHFSLPKPTSSSLLQISWVHKVQRGFLVYFLCTFRKQWQLFNVSSPVEKTPHFAGNNTKLLEVLISLSRFIWNYLSE